MPAFVKTPSDEKKWDKAKDIVKDQRDKSQDDFSDRDWGLTNHIFQNMKASLLERAAENAFQNRDLHLASSLYDQIENLARFKP